MTETQTIQESQITKILNTKSFSNKISTRDFCDNHKIPYVLCHIRIINDDKKTEGLEKGWTEWSYEKCMEHNKSLKRKMNAMNINIRKSNFMVIDIDDANTLKYCLDTFTNEWVSYSIRKKLPHLWRVKDENDISGDFTNSENKHYDLRFANIFERIDNYIYYNNENMLEWLSADHPKPKFKTDVINTSNKEIINTPSTIINDELIELLDIINIEYWTNYNDWFKLLMSIKSSYPDNYNEIAHKYSKKANNYDFDSVNKKLEEQVNNISAGTINYYAKLSNKDKYFDIKIKYKISFDCDDYSIAQTYLKLIADDIIISNNITYVYTGRLWKQDNTDKYLQISIINTLLDYYKKCINNTNNKIQSQIDPTATSLLEVFKKELTMIYTIISYIKSNNKQQHILKQVKLFINESNIQFDKIKPYYFVFNNIAFDLQTGKEVIITKEDYITQSTGYDYVKPTQQKIDEIDTILKQILPNDDYRNCELSILKSCLTGIRVEKFILANGSGRNGKGIISQLMALLLGSQYFYQGNALTLTERLKTGSNVEIANMDSARMIVFSEPEENAGLCLGVIKALTGEDSINARGLYSSKTKTQLNATFILEVNGKPNINGKINDSAIERWININFPNCFTDNDDLVDNITKFKQNKLYKNLEWREGIKCALFDLLLNFEGNDIVIPKSIRDDTMDYLCDSDPLLKWFNEHYEFVSENGNNHIVKVCDMFNILKESNFYYNLSKKAKRDEYTKKGLIDKIKENVKLKQYFFEKEKRINDISYKNYLTHCKKKTINQEEE